MSTAVTILSAFNPIVYNSAIRHISGWFSCTNWGFWENQGFVTFDCLLDETP